LIGAKNLNSEYIILTVFALITLSITIPSAFGVGLTFGPELTLSDSSGDSTDPQIAVNGSKIYVIWNDVDSTNGDTDILFKRSTDRGATFSSTAINVTSSLTGNIQGGTDHALLAFSETDDFVYVLWEDQDTVNGDNDIYFARSTDLGATFVSPVNLSAGLTGEPRDHAIAVNGTNVYVAWSDASQDATGDIYFRASTDGGANWTPTVGSAPIRIWNDGGSEPSLEPRLSAWGNNVYIVWQDEELGTTNDKMYFRSSSDNGANWTPTVGSTPTDLGGTAANTKRSPTMDVAGDKIHIAWRESTSENIFYRNATDSSGTLTFGPDLSSSPTSLRSYTGIPGDLQIAASEQHVNLVWRETISSPDRDTFFTNSTDRGVSFSDAKDLSGNGIEATDQDMATNGTVTFVVWSNTNSATDSDIVALASFSSSGGKFSGTASSVTDDDDDATNPDVGTDGTKMFVVWEDDTGDDEDPEIRFRAGTASGEDVDFDKSTYKLGDTVTLTVTSPSSNTNAGAADEITVTATSDTESGNISITLTETGNDTNEFTGTFTFSETATNDAQDILKAAPGDTISATFGSTTNSNASIFSRTVNIDKATYSIGDTTFVTVTDQNSNKDTGTAEKITVTISSSKLSSSSTTLQLTETGADTGIFGGSSDVTLRFSNETPEFPLNRDLTITQEFTAAQGTTDVTIASESEGGVTITLEEVGTTGQYKDVISFSTAASSGNSVQATAGEFVSITKGSLTTYGIITPRNDLSKAVLQVKVTGNEGAGVTDTITATFGGKSDTATVDFTGGESGGGGGGLVRPTVVLNAVASIAAQVSSGGSRDNSPPLSTLDNVSKLKSITVPDNIKTIIENQKPNVPIEPLENEPFALPLTINEKGYPLASNENTIVTNKIPVGESTKIKLVFYEQNELEHVSMYMNLRDGKRDDQSDTYIIFDKRNPMEIVDRNGFFESVNVEIIEEGPYTKIAIFDVKFAKPMETSDLIYKSWDLQRRSATVEIHDALKVGETPVTEEPTPTETIPEEPPVPKWIKSNAKWWSEGQIDDKTFTNGIGHLISEKIIDVPVGPNVSISKDENSEVQEELIEEVKIPEWLKSNAKWWADDLIDEDTFLSGIEYMVKNKIITIT
jgi:hypothetical protein